MQEAKFWQLQSTQSLPLLLDLAGIIQCSQNVLLFNVTLVEKRQFFVRFLLFKKLENAFLRIEKFSKG